MCRDAGELMDGLVSDFDAIRVIHGLLWLSLGFHGKLQHPVWDFWW